MLELDKKGQIEYVPKHSDNTYKISDLLDIFTPVSEAEIRQILYKIVNMLKTQEIEKEKDFLDRINEVLKLKPGIFGISIDVNALLRKLFKK